MTRSKTKSDSTDQQNDTQPVFQRINHIALAVRDLEAAIDLFQINLVSNLQDDVRRMTCLLQT